MDSSRIGNFQNLRPPMLGGKKSYVWKLLKSNLNKNRLLRNVRKLTRMVRRTQKLFPSIKMTKMWWGMTLRGPDLVFRPLRSQNVQILNQRIGKTRAFFHKKAWNLVSKLTSSWKWMLFGGPEGSFIPYLRVRPMFKVIWGQKIRK